MKRGSIDNYPRSNICRPVRHEESVEAVRQSVSDDLFISTRRRAVQLNMSRTSLRILKMDLGMFPYKIQMRQELLPQDPVQRLQYAYRFVQLSRDNVNFLSNVLMTDEAHFHLNGYVNKQNLRFWGTDNPRVLHRHQLHHFNALLGVE